MKSPFLCKHDFNKSKIVIWNDQSHVKCNRCGYSAELNEVEKYYSQFLPTEDPINKILDDTDKLWKDIITAGTSSGKLFCVSPEDNAKYLTDLADEIVRLYKAK